jgi:formylglycine-generating enzyme required for sulfatase activity
LLRAEPRLGGIYYELSHDSLVAPILEARRRRASSQRRAAVVATFATLMVATTVLGVFLFRAYNAARLSADRAVLIERLKNDNLVGVVAAVERLARDHGLTAGEITPLMDDARIVALMTTETAEACEPSIRLLSTTPAHLLGSRVLFGAALSAVSDLGVRCPESRGQAVELTRTLRERFVSVHPELTPQPASQADESLNPRIRIEGGSFLMGSPPFVGDDDEHPQHRVQVGPFFIQQHEVTNEEYRRFDPSHSFPESQGRHPVVNITWYDALAYAVWTGGNLPTEAQWEYTARGRTSREYAWGDDPPGGRTQYYPGFGESAPVATHSDAATPEGVHDLAGNISEWCRDYYARYTVEAVIDPTGPLTGQQRVVKGNSIYTPNVFAIAAAREPNYPNNPSANIGFRVVFSPP